MNAIFPPKLPRIIPLMGSPVDGEALGACRAVGRVLDRAGLSYRDLADVIPVREPSPGLGDKRDVARPSPFRGETWASGDNAYRPSRRKTYLFTPMQSAVHRRQALYCRNNDRGRLSTREREFIVDLASRRSELTVRQADWLAVICDRLEAEDRGL